MVGVLGAIVAVAVVALAYHVEELWLVLGGAAAAIVCAAVAIMATRSSLVVLRIFEAKLFAALFAVLVGYGWSGAHRGSTDSWLFTSLHLSILIAAYGALIPNSPRRAAVALLMIAGASIAALAQLRTLSETATTPSLAGPAIAIVISAAIALAASTLMGLVRSVAVETRLMSMYRLLGRLGEGSMGEIWRADHSRLARPAAIKIIRPDHLKADPRRARRLREQFALEAKMTAKLRSPHTISVYDFGTTDDETFFYVMEYLDGTNLDDLVAEHGPLSPARVVHILRQICESLADAHEQRVVHRDIKPSNVVLCRLGTSLDFVKVLDFGLAKPLDEQYEERFVSGTPAFLAPEVITATGEIDARSDLYAIGCLGFYLLTGSLVFEATGLVEMAAAHLDSTPPRPSQRARQAIPEELDTIILRCLAKDPNDRFDSAMELDRALSRVPVSPWTVIDAERWWRAAAATRPAGESAAAPR